MTFLDCKNERALQSFVATASGKSLIRHSFYILYRHWPKIVPDQCGFHLSHLVKSLAPFRLVASIFQQGWSFRQNSSMAWPFHPTLYHVWCSSGPHVYYISHNLMGISFLRFFFIILDLRIWIVSLDMEKLLDRGYNALKCPTLQVFLAPCLGP